MGQDSGINETGNLKSETVVYNDKLIAFAFDSIIRSSSGVILVTNVSCGGCVEYFAKEKIVNTFVYFINDLSIIEMNRVKFQVDNPEISFYYTLRTQQNEKLVADKSPQLIVYQDEGVRVVDYNSLDQFTKGFSLKGKKVRKNLHL
ncbi:hypothetical protein D3C86_1641200 [compost metagenome]